MKVKELKEALADVPDDFEVIGRQIDDYGDMGGPCYHEIDRTYNLSERDRCYPPKTFVLGGDTIMDGHAVYGVGPKEDYEGEVYPWVEIPDWPYFERKEHEEV